VVEMQNVTSLKIANNAIVVKDIMVIHIQVVVNLKDLFVIQTHVVQMLNVLFLLMEEVCVHVLIIWKETQQVHKDVRKLNVVSTVIVPIVKLASEINVKIHVQDLVEETHIAESKNIIQFVSVMPVPLEILITSVILLNHKTNRKILVIHRLVELMRTVK
jgi:hypothetical protein